MNDRPNLRLLGKRVLVTGSSRGIGAEIAKLFAAEGATVAVNYRASRADADSVVRSIMRKKGNAFSLQGDVSNPASVSRMFSEVRGRLGGLDVLVNNAGVSDGRIWNAKISEITLDMWRKVFAVDSFGTFLCTQAALGLMKRGGSIINVASTPAITGDLNGLVYASAKGSVVSMTKTLAKSLAPKVRVNCMVLGSVKTGWVDWLDERQIDSYKSAIPLGRFGKPRDVANLTLFLASDESSFITGQTVVIDGGEVLG
jgi:3-oxoacyl-[acyl-carrier protein] reductase